MSFWLVAKQPTNQLFEQISFTNYEWRALQQTCVKSGFALASLWIENCGEIAANDCLELADKLERYIKLVPEVEYFMDMENEALREELFKLLQRRVFPYRIHIESVRLFISFLRNCGGITLL